MICINEDVTPDGYILKSYSQGMTAEGECRWSWTITNGDQEFTAVYQFPKEYYDELVDKNTTFSSMVASRIKYSFENMVDPDRIDRKIAELKKELGVDD